MFRLKDDTGSKNVDYIGTKMWRMLQRQLPCVEMSYVVKRGSYLESDAKAHEC